MYSKTEFAIPHDLLELASASEFNEVGLVTPPSGVTISEFGNEGGATPRVLLAPNQIAILVSAQRSGEARGLLSVVDQRCQDDLIALGDRFKRFNSLPSDWVVDPVARIIGGNSHPSSREQLLVIAHKILSELGSAVVVYGPRADGVSLGLRYRRGQFQISAQLRDDDMYGLPFDLVDMRQMVQGAFPSRFERALSWFVR